MTTRNFRVNNGIEVGDIVISASTNKITGGATAAPSADGDFSNKKYVDDSIAAISTTAITQGNSNVTVADSGTGAITVSADATEVANFAVAATTITATGAINLSPGTDVVIPANKGITFGTGEKIEGDSTDLTVTSGAKINLAATSDVHIPQNVGIVFDANGTEKIESNDTDLTINSGAKINLTAVSDVHIPKNIGIVFDDNASEKIESDDTNLTISSGAQIILAPTTDVKLGNDLGVIFGDAGEKIEGDGTDLTISSSNLLNLSAATDIVIPTNVGLHFTDVNEKIESNGTDLTVNSGADINLTATADVNIPANVGVTFGDDGEKIEGNGTNLTIASSGLCTITATGETVVTNNFRVGGNLTVDGTETIVNTTTLSIEDNIIEVNRNVSANSGMPVVSGLQVNRGEGSTATEMPLLWAWDESFTDDGTTIHGNAGGAFTAFRRAEGNTEGPSGTASLVDIRANVVHAVATSAQYADVAERFEADAPMAAGAVVEVGGDAEITETTSDLSENVFGVISEQPAYAMNAAAGNNDTHPFVAMTGRTPVRVTGAVTKGQRLVSSSVKGCARAVASGESISPFNVIGRALESSTDAGIKLVNCAVRTNN